MREPKFVTVVYTLLGLAAWLFAIYLFYAAYQMDRLPLGDDAGGLAGAAASAMLDGNVTHMCLLGATCAICGTLWLGFASILTVMTLPRPDRRGGE